MQEIDYKQPFNREFVSQVFASKVDQLAKHQLNILNKSYMYRTGKTKDGLLNLKNNSTFSNDKITITYPNTIRFLDLKYHKHNNKKTEKTTYKPIFKRFVYGYMVGSGSNRNKKGISFLSILKKSIQYNISKTLTKISDNE